MMPSFHTQRTIGCHPRRGSAFLRRAALASLATATLTLAGCRNIRDVSGEPAPGPDVPRPEAVLDFKSLYAQNCAACHGEKGDHGAATNLANPAYEAWIDDTTLRNIIANGEKGVLMPAFAKESGGNLTDQQVNVLVQGLRAAWGPKPGQNPFNGATPPPYHQANAANPGNGQAVYTAACARCHGPDAQHPGKAGSVLDGSYLAMINAQTIRSTIVPGRPDVGQPDWRNDIPGQPLTDAQVTDVAAWMIAQTPAHPGHPYPLTPNTQPTTERPGEQQPTAEINTVSPSNQRDKTSGNHK